MESGRPCVGFSMEDAQEAYNHMQFEPVTDYGDTCNKHPLYTWDDGHRTLVRCKNCGGYALVQFSEFHAFSDGNDSYYCDMFPVSGAEEAEQLNRDFDGYQIEEKFQGKYLVRDNNDAPHWMRDMTDY